MGIADGIKSIAKLVKKYNDLELMKRIVDLETELLAIIEENNDIKRENTELKEAKAISESFVFEDNTYFRIEGGTRTGPYCSGCWDDKSKLVRLRTFNQQIGIVRRCPVCDSQHVGDVE